MKIPAELLALGMKKGEGSFLVAWEARKKLSEHLSLGVCRLPSSGASHSGEIVVELEHEPTLNECEIVRRRTLKEALPCIKALLAIPLS